jgi:hypothetical protein
VKIKEGKRKARIPIATVQDSLDEPAERFTIKLSKPKRAKLGDGRATGTIVDDDQPVKPPSPPPPPPPPPCTDGDGDGVCVEDDPPDCNDQNPLIAPGLTEQPDNGIDDDCDSGTPDGTSTADLDGDGWSVVDGDCNDTVSFIHPGATELKNRIDDDCDGSVDEGL